MNKAFDNNQNGDPFHLEHHSSDERAENHTNHANSIGDSNASDAAVDALERQRRIFQSIIDKANTHLVYLDSAFNFVAVNTLYAQTCGRTPEELIGKNHFALFPNEENEEIFERARDTGEAITFHDKPFVFHEQPERGVTYWDWTLTPIKNESGIVDGLVFSLVETTERKLTEDALRESNERFSSAFEYAPIGMALISPEGNWIKVNRAICNIVGYSEDELLSKTFQDITHPDDLETDLEYVRQMLHKEITSYQMEKRYYHKSGRIVWILLSVSLVLDNADEPLYFVSQIEDITERKQLENTLLFLLRCGWPGSGENFFESLARHLGESLEMDYVCIDRLSDDLQMAQTEAVFYNGQFEDNVAYSLKDTPCGEVVGTQVCYFPEGVRHRFPSDVVLQEMLAESYIGITLWSSDGKPIGLIAVIGRKPIANYRLAESMLKMVSVRAAGEMERQQAETALRDSEARLQLAQKSAGAGVWDWNITNDEMHWSIELYHMFGLDPETADASLETWRQAMHPDDARAALLTLRRAIEEHKLLTNDYRIVHPNGQIRWINAVGQTTYDNAGQPIRMTGICIDITGRKEAEDALAYAAERNRHIADVLQQALVPLNLPEQHEGYEIAAVYRPALSEAEVCGDFYDVFDLEDGKLGIVIGDILGKGLPAATRVAAVRHTIRSYAFEDDRPSCVMTLAHNALFRNHATESDMLTLVYAVLDMRAGTLVYSNAGHEPPILMRSDGSVEYLTEGGAMFNGLGKHIYVECNLNLYTGDQLVLVTDGITEARIQGRTGQFGPNGIVHSLLKNAGAPSEQIATGILEDATAFANGELRDDVAIVVIKKLNRNADLC